MSPLTSLHLQDAELKTAMASTSDPLFLSLLQEKRLQLSKRICAESSKIALARDRQYRSFHQTHSAPIKCGLASPVARVEQESKDPFYDKTNKKAGNRRARLLMSIQKHLFFSPSFELLEELEKLGTFMEGMEKLGMKPLLSSPEFKRKQKADKIKDFIEKQVKERKNLPFY